MPLCFPSLCFPSKTAELKPSLSSRSRRKVQEKEDESQQAHGESSPELVLSRELQSTEPGVNSLCASPTHSPQREGHSAGEREQGGERRTYSQEEGGYEVSGGLSAVPGGVIIYHWLALLTSILSELILGLLALSPLSPKVVRAGATVT